MDNDLRQIQHLLITYTYFYLSTDMYKAFESTKMHPREKSKTKLT